ncbi:MAG: redoxin domain-containing protein [Thermoleophilia bacterium]|nr:redoxin domain-containing protein [Thermoleophilia bacterium]
MNGRYRNVAAAVLGVVLILALAAQAGCGGAEAGGDAAPGFSGVTLDGTEVSLDGYRGKPLVLAFTASW